MNPSNHFVSFSKYIFYFIIVLFVLKIGLSWALETKVPYKVRQIKYKMRLLEDNNYSEYEPTISFPEYDIYNIDWITYKWIALSNMTNHLYVSVEKTYQQWMNGFYVDFLEGYIQ